MAEIRSIFGAEEIQVYLEHLERMHALEDESLSTEPADDDAIMETPEHRAAGRKRLAQLKELLTSTVLGTA